MYNVQLFYLNAACKKKKKTYPTNTVEPRYFQVPREMEKSSK